MSAQEGQLGMNSVERTLSIPLWCRALAADRLPQILPDRDAARILQAMGETKPPTVFYHMECACLAGAMRQYDFSKEIEWYVDAHPSATVVEMGAGLSCPRRQMGNDCNTWVNLDPPGVIACREKYIAPGTHELNIACDLTDYGWFENIPFDAAAGAIFYAAGVFHYFSTEQVKSLITAMADRFPGAALVFDTISDKEVSQGNAHVSNTGNNTRMTFTMNDAEQTLPTWSDRLVNTVQRSYLESYPVEGARYNPITRLYIRSKRDKLFVVHTEFRAG